jgi:thiol-disulfide isomerase/thioredoxin
MPLIAMMQVQSIDLGARAPPARAPAHALSVRPQTPPSWCPHCRAFKPEYEKVAAFCGRNTAIKVFRLDCATLVRGRRRRRKP